MSCVSPRVAFGPYRPRYVRIIFPFFIFMFFIIQGDDDQRSDENPTFMYLSLSPSFLYLFLSPSLYLLCISHLASSQPLFARQLYLKIIITHDFLEHVNIRNDDYLFLISSHLLILLFLISLLVFFTVK
jgi:hypothetical protein